MVFLYSRINVCASLRDELSSWSKQSLPWMQGIAADITPSQRRNPQALMKPWHTKGFSYRCWVYNLK
jgi:hypothetical protein